MKGLNTKTIGLFLIQLVVFTFISCGGDPAPPYEYEINPEYTEIGLGYYGAYYANQGFPNHVFSLQFFTEGMLNEERDKIVAPGQYLFIEDLFVSEERIQWFEQEVAPSEGEDNGITIPQLLKLLEGEYQASLTREAFTFSPGDTLPVDNMAFRIGARIYYLEESHDLYRSVIGGSFSVSEDGIQFNLITDDDKPLKGSYDFGKLKSMKFEYTTTREKESIGDKPKL